MSIKTKKRKAVDPQIASLVKEYDNNPEAILEIFQEIQARQGGIDKNVMLDVARLLGISAHHAFGVATFYSMLTTEPQKGGVIRVCDGPV